MDVCIGGISGWAGSALAHGVVEASDLTLVSGVSRRFDGKLFSDVGTGSMSAAPIFQSLEEALSVKPTVYVDYTTSQVVKKHVVQALAAGCHVVIGTSGLTTEDFQEIEVAAEKAGKAVLAAGNFALTAVLLQHFAEVAARYIPHREIIDYAKAEKKDAPSGTARELAHRLASVSSESPLAVPLDAVSGEKRCRGGRIAGTQIHSIRSPGYTIGIEILFGMEDQRLTISQEAGKSAEPYVAGGLLAIRKVHELNGLHHGLQSVMEL